MLMKASLMVRGYSDNDFSDCGEMKVRVECVVTDKPRSASNSSKDFVLEPLNYSSLRIFSASPRRDTVGPDGTKCCYIKQATIG